MAMSRILPQFLPRSSLCQPTALFSHHRHRSNKTHRAQLIETEVDQASSPPTDSPEEVITLSIKKDAIHSIIERRFAPDWLPFLPGYSYWVPPRASAMRGPHHLASSTIEVISKLASSGVVRNRGLSRDLLSEDEHMALSSAKTWPSSAFYIEGTSPIDHIPVVKVEMKFQDNDDQANNPSNSEDEEG